MRTLKDIRTAIQNRDEQPVKPITPQQTSSLETIREKVEIKTNRLHRDTPKIITVTVAGKEKRISVSRNKLQKTATKIAEEKRIEIITLQQEIDRKQEDAEKAGVVIVEEARKKAAEIIQNAKNEEQAVKSLKDTLRTRLLEVEKQAETQKTAQHTFNQKQTVLDALHEATEKDKEQVGKEKSDLALAREEVNGLLADLVAIMEIAVDRVAAISSIEEGQKARIAAALATADQVIRLIQVEKQKLEAKEEFLNNREKQMDTKWDIIKEERQRFLMMRKDPMFKK